MKRWLPWAITSVLVLLEFLMMIMVFVNVVPLEPAEFRDDAVYSEFITPAHSTFLGVQITEWFFFILTVSVIIPVTAIIMMELVRWALDQRKGAEVEPGVHG